MSFVIRNPAPLNVFVLEDKESMFLNIIHRSKTPNLLDLSDQLHHDLIMNLRRDQGLTFSRKTTLKIQGQEVYLNCFRSDRLLDEDVFDYTAFLIGYPIYGFSYFQKPKCFTCKKKCSLFCAGCDLAMYCSKDCQTKNWTKHKEVCKLIKERRNPSNYIKENIGENYED
jgi:hypothetical protein